MQVVVIADTDAVALANFLQEVDKLVSVKVTFKRLLGQLRDHAIDCHLEHIFARKHMLECQWVKIEGVYRVNLVFKLSNFFAHLSRK